AYSKAIELYPDHSASRNNLALLYMRTDQLDKAIAQISILRERGFDFPGAAGNLAESYAGVGNNDEAMKVVTEYVARFPDNEMGYLNLAGMQLAVDRLDDADASLKKALALRPGYPPVVSTTAYVALLRDDFANTRKIAQELLRFPAANGRSIGHMPIVYADLLQGQTAAALKQLQAAIADQDKDGSAESAAEGAVVAEILRARGQDTAAMVAAERAVADARGRPAAMEALFQGTVARSPRSSAELRRIAALLPAGSDKTSPLLADAILAIEDGHPAAALDLLKQYGTSAPPGVIALGSLFPVRQPMTEVSYWSARAELAMGNDDAAAVGFERVASAGYARLYSPIEYVRSFYYLGQIAEKKGDHAKARDDYGRFLKYWKDGDIDRDKIETARKIVEAGLQTRLR
ncbi:MAG: tetratricopeptide repeat protein, partial [Acidobacteriota bacterium]